MDFLILFSFDTQNNPMKWVLNPRLSNLCKVTKPLRNKVMTLT